GNGGLTAGTRIFAVTLTTAGTATITASDISDNTRTANTSPLITVTAGVVTKLQILLPGESSAPGAVSGKTGTPTAQAVATAIINGIVVNAVDANWNIISTATTNVTITSSDSNAVIADD